MYTPHYFASRLIIAVKFMAKYILAYRKQLSIIPFHYTKSQSAGQFVFYDMAETRRNCVERSSALYKRHLLKFRQLSLLNTRHKYQLQSRAFSHRKVSRFAPRFFLSNLDSRIIKHHTFCLEQEDRVLHLFIISGDEMEGALIKLKIVPFLGTSCSY